jgi:hypothetical protein
MSAQTKTYLGDSVYVEVQQFDQGDERYILTTENGAGPSNTIYLEPETMAALIRFVDIWTKS